MNVSERRVSLSGIQSEAVNPFTSAAMRVGSSDASKRVIGPTPLVPFSRFGHATAMPLPIGDTIPRPVTTTLRFDIFGGARRGGCRASGPWPGELLLDVVLHGVDGLLHRRDLLGLLVGDLALELFLERHHQLDVVEGIGTEVLD